eukprot:3389768-Pyramimonas_sp.AAC.2
MQPLFFSTTEFIRAGGCARRPRSRGLGECRHDPKPECFSGKQVKKGVADGKIKYKLDIQDGLENYIDVVNMLYNGSNDGKLMIKV